MSTTIRLDAQALSSLVANDPDFRLELQRAVVAEVVRKIVFKDMPDALQTIAPKLAGEVISGLRDDAHMSAKLQKEVGEAFKVWKSTSASWSHTGKYVLSAEMQKQVSEAVTDLKREAVGAAETAFNAELAIALEARKADYLAYVDRKMNEVVGKAIAAKIEAGVAERLAAIKAGL